MEKKMSWDHSLVKKYSSSNHFKMLNQLRSEVKKYPLNKKSNTSSNNSNNDDMNSSSIHITGKNKQLSITKNSTINQESYTNQSTISFNNSKNFSIYNNTFNDSPKEHEENFITQEKINYDEDIVSSTFKDRLNQVEMK